MRKTLLAIVLTVLGGALTAAAQNNPYQIDDKCYEYFQREVRPYVDDAWINLPPTKIGCEISFNKYFYKPAPLRSLEENERDIRELDKQSQGFIQSLFDLV